MGILDRAIEHFQSRPTHDVDVPEWGEGGQFKVYFRTPNGSILSRVNKESKGDPIEAAARMVALCSLDGNGEKLFKPLDYADIMKKTDPAVFSRIAARMMEEAKLDVSPAGMADAEKNSEAILSD
jgi:hypothetical protein